MIRNLRDTTIKNNEQDWLKTNLAKFSRMLQGQKDLLTVGKLILSELAPVVSAQQAVMYTLDSQKEEAGAEGVVQVPQGELLLRLLSSYASVGAPSAIRPGHGVIGQCAIEQQTLRMQQVPDDYIRIASGLGEARPHNV